MNNAIPKRGATITHHKTHSSTYPSNTTSNATSNKSPWGSKGKFGLNRSLLPTPLKYYEDIAHLKLEKGGVQRKTVCVFHEDSNPSLSINLDRGAYFCFSCGAKGGDIIAFHMAHTGLPFIEACKALGAWEGK